MAFLGPLLASALPAVIGNVIGGLSGLFNRRSSKDGEGGRIGFGGAAMRADHPLAGALSSGEKYGQLLDGGFTNNAGAIPSETQTAITPSRDEFAAMALPAFANPKELIQNPFFDDSLQQTEVTVPILSNGGSQSIVAGTEWIWNIGAGEMPIRLRGMRLLVTSTLSGQYSNKADSESLMLVGQMQFWEIFSQMQIYLNNNTILTYTAQNSGGLRAFAFMDKLNDALRHSTGNTAYSCWSKDSNRGPMDNVTLFGTDSPAHSMLQWFNMSSSTNVTYSYPNRPFLIELPFGFFNTTHHLGRLNTLRISLIANASTYQTNHLNLYPVIAQTTPGTTTTLVFGGTVMFTNHALSAHKVIGMYTDIVPLSSATRQQMNLPYANRILKHEVFMIDWDPFYIPTGSQWTASPYLIASGTRWDQSLNQGIYITSQGTMPMRSFAMMEVTVSTKQGASAAVPFDTIFLPGAITHQSHVRNGTQYDILQSCDQALNQWGTPGSDSENIANYLYYMDRRRQFDYDNTNTSLNLPSAYELMRNKVDNLQNRLGILYSAVEGYPKKWSYINQLANQMPDMIKPDNIPNNINGLTAPHVGQLEGRYYIAPLEGMAITCADIANTAYTIVFNYKALWIFRERYHSASYGLGLETAYVDLLSMLLPVEPKY